MRIATVFLPAAVLLSVVTIALISSHAHAAPVKAACTPHVYTVVNNVGPEWSLADSVCAQQHGGHAIGIGWYRDEPMGRQIQCEDLKTWSVEDGKLMDVSPK